MNEFFKEPSRRKENISRLLLAGDLISGEFECHQAIRLRRNDSSNMESVQRIHALSVYTFFN
jgi:hypothetical protein